MINELIERSPIRIFEKSVSGGLGAGHIGVVTSKEGVGKTAFLVQLGLDKMLQDKHIVHISFSDKVDHILGWYQNLFMELSASKKIENPLSVYDNICKNRIILNFNSEKISVVDSLKKVELLISDARYNVDSIYFDGITVGMLKKEDFAALRQFAQTLNLEVWLSLTVKQYDENGIAPSVREFVDEIDILIDIRYKDDHIQLEVAKDRDDVSLQNTQLKLDRSTFLLKKNK